MKTKRIAYKVDEFVDYTGTTRKFTIAAVSIIPEGCILVEAKDDKFNITDKFSKILSIGVSVCRPNDTFNEELGIQIATGKAIKNSEHRLYTNDQGLINNLMVNALLEQECKYFKSNPGRYLKGYDKDKQKFLKISNIKSIEEELSLEGKNVIEFFRTASDEEIKKSLTVICAEKQLI